MCLQLRPHELQWRHHRSGQDPCRGPCDGGAKQIALGGRGFTVVVGQRYEEEDAFRCEGWKGGVALRSTTQHHTASRTAPRSTAWITRTINATGQAPHGATPTTHAHDATCFSYRSTNNMHHRSQHASHLSLRQWPHVGGPPQQYPISTNITRALITVRPLARGPGQRAKGTNPSRHPRIATCDLTAQ